MGASPHFAVVVAVATSFLVRAMSRSMPLLVTVESLALESFWSSSSLQPLLEPHP
jgi:hypothetical protein